MELRGTPELLQQNKTKLSRTSTRKVRTGCITCKKRHIRCDEEKPHCRNCLKNRGYCEGYAVTATKSPDGPGQLCWDSTETTPDTSSLVVQRQPSVNPPGFQDPTGVQYFQEFVGLFQGPWITAGSIGDLWRVTFPQLAHNNATLRHASMAIGALSMWYSQSPGQSLSAMSVPALAATDGDAHYFRAVDYYCRALQIQSRQESVQDTIFLSVMLMFFESLCGNRKASLAHVNHGLALLLDLLTTEESRHHVANFSPNPKPVLGTLADVFIHLGPQARAILPGRIGGSNPPLPNLTKGLRNKRQTMEEFMVFLSQLTRSSVDLDSIPAAFRTLDEFEEYWTVAWRGQTGVTAVVVEVMRNSGALGSKNDDDISALMMDVLENPRIKKHWDVCRKAVASLDAAFLPLFNEVVISEPGSPNYLRAIHLRLQYLGFDVFNDPSQFFNSEALKTRTPICREYLSLVGMALRTAKRQIKNPAYQLSLQSGLSWYIFLISIFCRDPLTRDEAVCMLGDYPGHDGLWDTRSLYILALRNRAVERMNASEGTPEEQWRRLWRREFVFEEGGERIVLRYMEKDAATGSWQLVEETAAVSGESVNVHWERQPLTGSGGLLAADLYYSEELSR